jgi:hypothetical protein
MILSFLQDIVPAPLARTIPYKIEGPIFALGCWSPTLAQLMSRYATLDPILNRPASDKRKAPSLIASPTVTKKRTSKKLLIQVRTPSFLEHNVIHHSDHLYLCLISDQNSATSGHHRFYQCFIYLVKFSPSYSSSSLALINYLLLAEETLVSQTVGSSSPQHDSNPASSRIQPSSPQPEASASPRTHPASSQPDIQEPFLEPEKLPSPTREARNDVSTNTHPSIFIQ